MKTKQQKFALLPPKEAEVEPWKTLCINEIGPYTFGQEDPKHKDHKYLTKLHCLTMIDPATGWFEIAQVDDKSAHSAASKLEQIWLMRYPWPEEVICDRGTEFRADVQDMLADDYGINRNPITTRNPQANAIVERAHKTLHNLIRVQKIRDKRDLEGGSWDGVIAAISFAMRATVHTTTQATPTQLVFGRDHLRNIGFQANWNYIKSRKQHLINENNRKENASRIPHEYKVNDQVLIKNANNRKHGDDQYSGPYTIVRINDNGTVKLQQKTTKRGGVVHQTWNVRNLFPYKA
jgi:hypothetical protein